jgi:hypothetical protein
MNVTLFKKLIKDAVVEAIHTELPSIINEALAKQNKQQISEGKTFNFNSGNVPANGLPQDVRSSLMAQMGESFGYSQSQPQATKLAVIDAVDESTGERVNPYLAFINDAANNMSHADKAGLRNLD